jgi:hypothetical protein
MRKSSRSRKLTAAVLACGFAVAQPLNAGSAEWVSAAEETSGSAVSFGAVNDTGASPIASGVVLPERSGLPEGVAPTWRMISQAADSGEQGKALFANADEAARKTSNPLGGDFMVLINEWHYTSLEGSLSDGSRETISHIFQPVIPFSLEETIGDDWIMVNRPTLPIIYSAEVPDGFNSGNGVASFGDKSGVADLQLFSLIGVSKPQESNTLLGAGDLVLAGGFSLSFPTGSSTFTSNAWAAGPAGVAAYIGEKGVLGALVQTQFQYASSGSTMVDHNKMFIQPFYLWSLGGGWQVGGTPLWTFDFETDEEEIPLGFGFQKVQMFNLGEGKVLPVRFGLEARYFVDQMNSSLANEWEIVLQISPILPNIFGNLLKGCPMMSVGGC